MSDPNTENKMAWVQVGVERENNFVAERAPKLGIAAEINPAKAEDPYTHDLMVRVVSDLKAVRTPLFMARELYRLDPQYTVTLNVKDYDRYADLYPDIVVIFDVLWAEDNIEREFNGTLYRVEPMHATYWGFLSHIADAITTCGNHKHTYQRRLDDTDGNAKWSWVFDVRKLHRVHEK
jgi:hypothetical protein